MLLIYIQENVDIDGLTVFFPRCHKAESSIFEENNLITVHKSCVI